MNKLNIYGVRGSMFLNDKNFLKYGCNTSCYLNIFGDKYIMVDCGSGVINAIEEVKKLKELHLLITHPHFDHLVGIVQLVSLCKDTKIHIYGTNIKKALDNFMGPPYWPIEVSKCKNVSVYDINGSFNIDNVKVDIMESNHPGGCNIYKLTYNNKNIVFGFDFNHGDGYDLKMIDFSKNCDVLLYDGSLTEDEYRLHSTWGHSTCANGVRIARLACVKMLIITHHNYINDDSILNRMERELQKEFANGCFAKEMQIIEY